MKIYYAEKGCEFKWFSEYPGVHGVEWYLTSIMEGLLKNRECAFDYVEMQTYYRSFIEYGGYASINGVKTKGHYVHRVAFVDEENLRYNIWDAESFKFRGWRIADGCEIDYLLFPNKFKKDKR
ncbi:MAG: hypothetical protein KAS32_21365 [Candidatus Peribacteraceae bacterium]|nr:hypothetical protein [Candidatus Peribacteraceae bacterium]